MNSKIIGIMGAMPEEVNDVVNLLTDREDIHLGMRTYSCGRINGAKVVVVFARWGKVAAAATVATLILKFNVSEIIFTGLGGAVSAELHQGDIVIAKRLIQHDLDARPIMEEFELPLLGVKYLETPRLQLERAIQAVSALLADDSIATAIGRDELQRFGLAKPCLHVGDIASGDKFFANSAAKNELLQRLPETLCVEMEGAAVAQVCYEYDVPFTVVRTISDSADEKSHTDFPSFTEKIANKYSVEIIKKLLAR